MQETQVHSLGREDPLEKEMATHSSIILAWEIPWTEEPGGLQSMGSQSWPPLSTHARILKVDLPWNVWDQPGWAVQGCLGAQPRI